MYNFFANAENRQGDLYIITGSDCNHMKNVLRMKAGEKILVSDGGKSHLCVLEGFDGANAVLRITEENYQDTELPIKIYLFQGLPKSDKLELIIQKTVELGVHGIIPVEMNRSIVKLDEKKKGAKRERWQAIAESAAKQSKRCVIPEVFDVMTYKQAMEKAKEMDVLLIPYENENGMKATSEALENIKPGSSVGILIGPEGGFEEKEVAAAIDAGGISISLGKRILRTETAAITSVGMCMLYAEMKF